jgi:hypothetical protein
MVWDHELGKRMIAAKHHVAAFLPAQSKPTLPSAFVHSRPEMHGSVLTPQPEACRIALQESADDLPPTP